MDIYSRNYNIRWADLDANGHVHYSAYIDAAADLRYTFFTEHGFPPEAFLKAELGAVYSSLEARFLREVRVGEIITITYWLAGLSANGIRWKVNHVILKANGKKAVELVLEGLLLDLKSRKPVQPTPDLLAVFNQIPRSANFTILPEVRLFG